MTHKNVDKLTPIKGNYLNNKFQVSKAKETNKRENWQCFVWKEIGLTGGGEDR